MEKYLRLYAEPETVTLDQLPAHLSNLAPWANVLVIPACNETPELLLRPSPPCSGRSLLILVINESVAAAPAVSSANRALAAAVEDRFELMWRSDSGLTGAGMALFRDPGTPRDLLRVDRYSVGRQLPAKGGVGHARKVGADLAASLVSRGRILSPWIHCSDADVELPEEYFTCSNKRRCREEGLAALVYPYYHFGQYTDDQPDEVLLATRIYEISLRYYVAGLKSAGSPYAFHTIGSTMAVHARYYAKVRGFPRREAAEDFYLLNKLAKVGTVLELEPESDCAPIRITARRSDRVPFGTGAAVDSITKLNDPAGEFRFYNPAVFGLLKNWLQSWPAIWHSASAELAPDIVRSFSTDRSASGRAEALWLGLENMGARRALEHAFRQSADLCQFERQMHTWFDAFRTLKLVHFLRDHGLPPVSYDAMRVNQDYADLFENPPYD